MWGGLREELMRWVGEDTDKVQFGLSFFLQQKFDIF